MSNNNWSDWLDFSEEQVIKAPKSPGVFMMHAAMKILFIGGSDNIRAGLVDKLSDMCTSEATRYRFMETNSFEQTKNDLIKEYRERHEGNLPRCMEIA